MLRSYMMRNKKDVFDRFKNVFCVQMVIQERFELPTHGLEGRCSIQLSYWTVCRKLVGAAGFEPATPWSQARCSTKLSHAPMSQQL